MIKANFNTYNNYVTDSLYQWDLNQDLIINGLNLSVAPEIHFANANMDRAIVRQSALSSGVVTVRIPNSLLQEALTIKAYVGIYEGTTFNVIEIIEIPVIAKPRLSDYALTDSDEEIYSFKALENQIANMISIREFNNNLALITARIDKIIAHNNDTEANSELLDLRTKTDGTTADSAGTAIREQLTGLSDKIDNTFSKFTDYGDGIYYEHSPVTFSQGLHITAIDGVNSNTKCVYNTEILTGPVLIRFPEGYIWRTYKYNDEGTNTGVVHGKNLVDSALILNLNSFYDDRELYLPEGYSYYVSIMHIVNDAPVLFDPTEADIAIECYVPSELNETLKALNDRIYGRGLVKDDDLDLLIDTGQYFCNTDNSYLVKNWPAPGFMGIVEVIKGVTATTTNLGSIQRVTTADGNVYVRYLKSIGYTQWYHINTGGQGNADHDLCVLQNNNSKMLKPWTALLDIPALNISGITDTDDNGDKIHLANTTLKGLPYSQAFYSGGDILTNRTVASFYSAMLNPASILYTKRVGNNNTRALAYGIVCSSFVSYYTGQDIFWNTTDMWNILDFYDLHSLSDIRIGDVALMEGHARVITNITYDDDYNVETIEISEAAKPVAKTVTYTADGFKAILQEYGGDYVMGRFPETNVRSIEDQDYSEVAISEYGDKTYFERGAKIWMYFPGAVDNGGVIETVYYGQREGGNVVWTPVALRDLSYKVVNGVMVYDFGELLDNTGIWYINTSETETGTATLEIINLGEIVVDESANTFTPTDYSDNVTPRWFMMIYLTEGTPLDYWYHGPEGYYANQSTKQYITETPQKFTPPVKDGYYVRVFYKTRFGFAIKDSDYVLF